jgi:hypothetical protein
MLDAKIASHRAPRFALPIDKINKGLRRISMRR